MNATEYFRNVKVCQRIRSSKCRDGRKRSSPSSFCALSLQCYKISEENDVHTEVAAIECSIRTKNRVSKFPKKFIAKNVNKTSYLCRKMFSGMSGNAKKIVRGGNLKYKQNSK